MSSGRLIDLSTLTGYFAVLLIMAWMFRKENRNIGDYFRSGCRGTWWLIGMSTFMTSFSAFNFTGVAGIAYDAGWAGLLLFIAPVIGFLINAAWFAPWFRQLRVLSAAQMVRLRFDPLTHQVFSWFLVVLQTLFAAIQLYGLAIFSAAMFELDLNAVILVVGFVVVLASVVGGNWAVTAADFLQGVILLPVMVLMGVLCLAEVGGVGGFFDLIRAQGLEQDYRMIHGPDPRLGYQFTIGWAVAMVLKSIVDLNSTFQAPRYFAAKDGRDASKAALLTAGLTAACSVLWLVPPMVARLLYADRIEALALPRPGEASYAVASALLLPAGMSGLMVVTVFAATMSSMDSGLNRNAAVFTADIYPALRRRLKAGEASERELLRIGEGITLLFGLLIVALAYEFANHQTGGIFQLGIKLSTIIGFPLTLPLCLSLVIRNSPRWAGLFCAAATAVPSLFGALAGSPLGAGSGIALLEERWTFQQQTFWNLGVGTAAYLVSVLFWGTATAPYRQQVKEFFATMTRRVDFAAEVGEENDDVQRRILGSTCLLSGLLTALLLLIPNPWTLRGRLGILFVVATLIGTWVWLRVPGRRESSVRST